MAEVVALAALLPECTVLFCSSLACLAQPPPFSMWMVVDPPVLESRTLFHRHFL